MKLSHIQEARYATGSRYVDGVIDIMNSPRKSDRFNFPMEHFEQVIDDFRNQFGPGTYYEAQYAYEWKAQADNTTYYILIGQDPYTTDQGFVDVSSE